MVELRALAPALLAASLAACASSADGGAGRIALEDVAGGTRRPLDVRGALANVVVFTTVDCPIANGYAPEIRALAEEFGPAGVRFFLVHVDPDVTAAGAAAHAREYGYELPVLLDPDHDLVRALGASITPEAAVALPDGVVVYRGRIDDLYAELGVKRAAATRHDLREVLAGIVAGRSLPIVRTEAIGCYIPGLVIEIADP